MISTIDYTPHINAVNITEPTAIRYQTSLATITPNGDGTYQLALGVQSDNPSRLTRNAGNGPFAKLALANHIGIPCTTREEQGTLDEAFKTLTAAEVGICLETISTWYVNTVDLSNDGHSRAKG